MAILDVFKKKSKKEVIKKDVKAPAPAVAAKKVFFADSWRIFKMPHVSEKATNLAESGRYIFEIYERSNKTEIKKAVGSAYGVDVVSVKIINSAGKERKSGRSVGWHPGCKKAIVKIKQGQKIEVLPR